ncbi:MAG TPA: ceramidase domain-containing protein [Polyangia bacterium]|nr:ceramidase domain-containing protein [Polyangia bacterium]
MTVPPRRAAWVLGGLAVLALAGCFAFLPKMVQPEAYHRFADGRSWLGIPNFLDVVSNLPFLVVGLVGLRVLGQHQHPSTAFTHRWERRAFAVLFAGVALVALGSGYYHAHPTSPRLFWDRLPMTIVFSVLVAITIGERIGLEAGRRTLPALAVLGIGSVMVWRATDDLRLYGFVQFFSMLALPLLLVLRPPRYTRTSDLVAMMALYVGAKLCEQGDGVIFALGGLVSGHTCKHLLAAAATYQLVRHVRMRSVLLQLRAQMSLHDLTATTIDLQPQPLSAWKGKVLLVVNTASECGYTPQYAGLEQLSREYAGRGLVVLGFPSNDFGGQEPGTEAEIKSFCSTRYKVTFPLFSKVVTKGPGQSPVYQFLTAKHEPPRWNFHKYLVGKDGEVIRAFGHRVPPEDRELRAAIDAALG